jgi:hypothetical protein
MMLLVLYCDDCITVHTVRAADIGLLRCWKCNKALQIIDTAEPQQARSVEQLQAVDEAVRKGVIDR